MKNKISFQVRNFVEESINLEKSSIVISDKVVCCYPNMPAFINVTTSHANKYYGIVYPKDSLIFKLMINVMNWLIQFTKKKGFKVYSHNNEKIRNLIESKNFHKIFSDETFLWKIELYKKSP